MYEASPTAAYVSVASNIDPERNILRSLVLLSEWVAITGLSTFYRTAPLGRPEQADYLNGVVAVRCPLGLRALKFDVLRPIEAQLGRVRTDDPYAARTIDLDVLVFGEMVVEEADLRVPDPDIAERVFLAAALAEVAPDLRLPNTGRMLVDCFDPEEARALAPNAAFTEKLRARFRNE